jgi:hypothetical protein
VLAGGFPSCFERIVENLAHSGSRILRPIVGGFDL